MDQAPDTPQIPADLPGGPRVEPTQESRDGDHRRDLGLRGVRDHEVPGICHGMCPRAGDSAITSKCPMKEIAV